MGAVSALTQGKLSQGNLENTDQSIQRSFDTSSTVEIWKFQRKPERAGSSLTANIDPDLSVASFETDLQLLGRESDCSLSSPIHAGSPCTRHGPSQSTFVRAAERMCDTLGPNVVLCSRLSRVSAPPALTDRGTHTSPNRFGTLGEADRERPRTEW